MTLPRSKQLAAATRRPVLKSTASNSRLAPPVVTGPTSRVVIALTARFGVCSSVTATRTNLSRATWGGTFAFLAFQFARHMVQHFALLRVIEPIDATRGGLDLRFFHHDSGITLGSNPAARSRSRIVSAITSRSRREIRSASCCWSRIQRARLLRKKMPPRINAVLLFIMGLLDQTKLRQAMPAAMRAVPDQRVTDATSPSRRAPTPKFPQPDSCPGCRGRADRNPLEREPQSRWPPCTSLPQRPTQRIGPPAVMARRPSG